MTSLMNILLKRIEIRTKKRCDVFFAVLEKKKKKSKIDRVVFVTNPSIRNHSSDSASKSWRITIIIPERYIERNCTYDHSWKKSTIFSTLSRINARYLESSGKASPLLSPWHESRTPGRINFVRYNYIIETRSRGFTIPRFRPSVTRVYRSYEGKTRPGSLGHVGNARGRNPCTPVHLVALLRLRLGQSMIRTRLNKRYDKLAN